MKKEFILMFLSLLLHLGEGKNGSNGKKKRCHMTFIDPAGSVSQDDFAGKNCNKKLQIHLKVEQPLLLTFQDFNLTSDSREYCLWIWTYTRGKNGKGENGGGGKKPGGRPSGKPGGKPGGKRPRGKKPEVMKPRNQRGLSGPRKQVPAHPRGPVGQREKWGPPGLKLKNRERRQLGGMAVEKGRLQSSEGNQRKLLELPKKVRETLRRTKKLRIDTNAISRKKRATRISRNQQKILNTKNKMVKLDRKLVKLNAKKQKLPADDAKVARINTKINRVQKKKIRLQGKYENLILDTCEMVWDDNDSGKGTYDSDEGIYDSDEGIYDSNEGIYNSNEGIYDSNEGIHDSDEFTEGSYEYDCDEYWYDSDGDGYDDWDDNIIRNNPVVNRRKGKGKKGKKKSQRFCGNDVPTNITADGRKVTLKIKQYNWSEKPQAVPLEGKTIMANDKFEDGDDGRTNGNGDGKGIPQFTISWELAPSDSET